MSLAVSGRHPDARQLRRTGKGLRRSGAFFPFGPNLGRACHAAGRPTSIAYCKGAKPADCRSSGRHVRAGGQPETRQGDRAHLPAGDAAARGPGDPVSGEGGGLKPVEPIVEAQVRCGMHRGRLFRKYFLLILALVCGALLISGGIGLYFSYQENKDALASLQREKAAGAAARIEQFVQPDRAAARVRRAAAARRRGPGAAAHRVPQAAAPGAGGDRHRADRRQGPRAARGVAPGDGRVGAGEDRSQEPAFKNARPGQTWFGPVYFRKETEPYMSIAVRSGGESGPVTVADVNLKFIWDVVTQIKIGQKGKAYVVDSSGYLVADPDIGLVLRKTDLSGLAQVKAAFAPGADDSLAMFAQDLAGNSVLTAYAPIEPGREQAAPRRARDAAGLEGVRRAAGDRGLRRARRHDPAHRRAARRRPAVLGARRAVARAQHGAADPHAAGGRAAHRRGRPRAADRRAHRRRARGARRRSSTA